MESHKRHKSDCDIEPDIINYRNAFSRNTTDRASTGTLKQPRLPGSEKFRFSQVLFVPDVRPSSCYRKSDLLEPSYGGGLRHSKRKPIIPISKNTSHVLNNTNAELSAETIDFIRNETSNLTTLCKRYITERQTDEIQSDGWSCSSSEQSVEGNASTLNNNKAVGLSSFATIKSSRLRSRPQKFDSPSPTCSMSSNEDDVWVLRDRC